MKKKDEIAVELKALGADFGDEGATDSMFHTPENYFGSFPDQMLAVIHAMNTDTLLTLPVPKSGPFDVPQGYFDGLCTDILAKTRAMEAITEQGQYAWDKKQDNPFSLPAGYFAQFDQQLFSKLFSNEPVAEDEIETLSPLLASLKKEQPFAVPTGYFNSEAFTQQVQVEGKPKVAEHPSVRSIKWARWAAAAAVIAIFAMGGLHYLIPSGEMGTKPSFEQSLAQIPNKNIKEWLLSNMDEADINGLGSSITKITSIPSPTLNGISEKEIQDYLENEVW